MKTYLKTLVRVFKKHITRLVSIVFMVVISVGFVAGIGCAVDKIDFSLTDYYKTQNVSDFIAKSKKDEGFSEEDIAFAKERYGEKNVSAGASVDFVTTIEDEERTVRLYFFDGEQTVNVQTAKARGDVADDVEFPAKQEQKDNKIKELPFGTEITLNFKDILTQLSEQNGKEPDSRLNMLPDSMATRKVTVTETVLSPLTFAMDGEPSYLNPEDTKIPDNINDVNALKTVDHILYLSYDCVPSVPMIGKLLPKGDLYLAAENRALFEAFGKDYNAFVKTEKAALEERFGDCRILTLNDNYSFKSLHSYAEKVQGITIVLMVVFLLVTALVVLSTMTRLIEEERAQVACLSTLGYPPWRIIFKYVLFAMIGCGIGGAGAYFVEVGVATLLYVVFNYSFAMPPMTPRIAIGFYLLVYFFIVIVTLIATALAGRKMTNEKPANLLRPKVPKAGKKVFLERIPFFWNLLSFKYKSTTRNVLRYKSRFFMTVIAVAFSTALVMAGLALLDLCLFHGIDSPSVMAVAIVVVAFAGLLTAVVIYTLTNINISERNRELATLMVLGYHNKEVAGYIYREVYIDTVVGILFGYPCSCLLIWLVFTVMGMGTLGGVSWFVWLIAPAIILLFTAAVTLLLRRKIVKIDMNESLKAIE